MGFCEPWRLKRSQPLVLYRVNDWIATSKRSCVAPKKLSVMRAEDKNNKVPQTSHRTVDEECQPPNTRQSVYCALC